MNINNWEGDRLFPKLLPFPPSNLFLDTPLNRDSIPLYTYLWGYPFSAYRIAAEKRIYIRKRAQKVVHLLTNIIIIGLKKAFDVTMNYQSYRRTFYDELYHGKYDEPYIGCLPSMGLSRHIYSLWWQPKINSREEKKFSDKLFVRFSPSESAYFAWIYSIQFSTYTYECISLSTLVTTDEFLVPNSHHTKLRLNSSNIYHIKLN